MSITRARTHVIALAGPRAEVYLSARQLATVANISPARLGRLVRLGLVEPVARRPGSFTADTAMRLRRMLRLHDDLGVNLCGAAIIVDLVDRLERTRAEEQR
ncbi:MAG: hypothetical protein FJ027_16760 [Candidatus Rokubacteria bacterium]|nr:hypothetical protein [Candidatus Rokubacteria bacterium]